MTYPIFNSFTNQIQNELTSRAINIKTFKTWHEDRINATGLEILIDVQSNNNFIKEVAINFDWDRFRETVLASQLDGLGEHPMLQEGNLKSTTVSPKIDVEISWVFDEKRSEIALPNLSEGDRLESAGRWIQEINSEVNKILNSNDVVTRWHIEVEGNHTGKRLSTVSLISYFQYQLADLKSLNEAHYFVKRQLQDLLVKSKKVRKISDHTIENAA